MTNIMGVAAEIYRVSRVILVYLVHRLYSAKTEGSDILLINIVGVGAEHCHVSRDEMSLHTQRRKVLKLLCGWHSFW